METISDAYELYLLDTSDISEFIKNAIKSFEKKHGYSPQYMVMHEEMVAAQDISTLEESLPYRRIAKNFNVMHIALCPIHYRTPRILDVERTPWTE